MEEKRNVPKKEGNAREGPSLTAIAKGKILEELKLMAGGQYEYGKVAAKINSLPIKDRKAALVSFLEESLGKNTVDGIDFNEILRAVKLPEADRKYLVENYQKFLHH